jgi:hypothetical protein
MVRSIGWKDNLHESQMFEQLDHSKDDANTYQATDTFIGFLYNLGLSCNYIS